MNEPLRRIERANVVLGLAVTAAAGLLGGPRAWLAAGIGALIGAVNFRFLSRLATGAAARAIESGSAGQALGLVTALTGKMVALFVLVWAVQRFLDLDALPFAAGLTAFVWSCMVVGLFSAPSALRASVAPARGKQG